MSRSSLEVFIYTREKSVLLDEILRSTGRSTAGWHYCLDYAFALNHFRPDDHYRILDIGCGPYGNALHDYLEGRFGKQVLGLDRTLPRRSIFDRPRRIIRRLRGREQRPTNHIDYDVDLLDFTEGGWDLVLAISSLEHNRPEVTRACWQHACSLLAEDGLLVATFPLARDGNTKWDSATHASILSVTDAQKVWDCSFEGDLEQVITSYSHPYLYDRYADRFGAPWTDGPAYLAAGVVKKST